MIIEVKATRTPDADADPASRYVAKRQNDKSKTPYVFGLFLLGVGLYLKSVFPSWVTARTAPPEEDDQGGAPLDVAEAPMPLPVDQEAVTGTVGAKQTLAMGSSGKLVELIPSAEFLQVPNPHIGDYVPPEAPLVWRDYSPVRLVSAENDNSSGSVQPGPETGSPGGGTNTPRPPVVDGDDPEPGPGPGEPEACGPGDDGDDGGGCGCSGPKPEVPPACADDDGNDREQRPCTSNRAPRVSGPVYLLDVTGCAVALIALNDLLKYASDPDDDVLAIADLKTSSGSLVQTDDGWLYSAAPQFTGQVTLTYTITDGELSTAQTALFSVVSQAYIEGTVCDDTLTGTDCADVIAGLDGDDRIDARGGNDVVYGGTGNDVIYGGSGNDHIWGGAGNDRIFGEAGDDIIYGGDGDDFIRGGAGNDILFGEAGNDVIYGDDGDDRIDGGDGDDELHGGAGNDVLIGGAGNDSLYGGEGDDLLLDGEGADEVYGGAGNDTVVASLDQADDIYDGGEGCDTLDYSAATQALRIDLIAGTACGVEIGHDSISGFEVVKGGAGNDHFTIGNTPVTLAGGGGDNVFEFALSTAGDPTPREAVVYEILDFKVGDRIRMDKYELFEKVFDQFEDDFEKMYGDDIDDDDVRILYRHDDNEGMKRTVIEADFNLDGIYETTIMLEGRHLSVVIENV